jgi:phospholipid transport system substrate-binding protein
MKSKHYMSFIRVVVFSLFAGLLVSMNGFAADFSEPQTAIEDASNKLKIRMQEPGFTQDFRKINAFVNEVIYPHVDFDVISQLVLGKLWKDASPAEKDSFKKEFQILLVRTYSRAFVEFKDWSVRFLPVNKEENEKKAMVKTEILQPGLQPIAVNYRMHNINGAWKVYDISIEGVSLVTNYRTSFKNEVEQSGSLQQVIDQLAKRNNEALSAQKHP